MDETSLALVELTRFMEMERAVFQSVIGTKNCFERRFSRSDGTFQAAPGRLASGRRAWAGICRNGPPETAGDRR